MGFIAKTDPINKIITIFYVKGYEKNLTQYGLNKDRLELQNGNYAINLKEVDKATFDKEYGYNCYKDGRVAPLYGYITPVGCELQPLTAVKKQ